jgi:hypothetical protein
MPPSEIPQLDNVFTQAVGEDLCKKLLRHSITTPAAAVDKNLQSFSNIALMAIEQEDELKTVTNIAERAAFRAGGQQTQRNSQFTTKTEWVPELS